MSIGVDNHQGPKDEERSPRAWDFQELPRQPLSATRDELPPRLSTKVKVKLDDSDSDVKVTNTKVIINLDDSDSDVQVTNTKVIINLDDSDSDVQVTNTNTKSELIYVGKNEPDSSDQVRFCHSNKRTKTTATRARDNTTVSKAQVPGTPSILSTRSLTPTMIASESATSTLVVQRPERTLSPSTIPLSSSGRQKREGTFTDESSYEDEGFDSVSSDSSSPLKTVTKLTGPLKDGKNKLQISQLKNNGNLWNFQERLLKKMVAEGHTSKEIGKALGRKDTAVDRRCYVLGLPIPRKRPASFLNRHLVLLKEALDEQKTEVEVQALFPNVHWKSLLHKCRSIRPDAFKRWGNPQRRNGFTMLDSIATISSVEKSGNRTIIKSGNLSWDILSPRYHDFELGKIIVDVSLQLTNIEPLAAALQLPYTDVSTLLVRKSMIHRRDPHLQASDSRINALVGMWIPISSSIRGYTLAQINHEHVWNVLLYTSSGRQREIFQDQVRPIHDDKGIFVCSLCDLGFQNEQEYYCHSILHDDARVYLRPCCLLSTSDRASSHVCQLQQGFYDSSRQQRHSTIKTFTSFSKSDVTDHDPVLTHEWWAVLLSVRWSAKVDSRGHEKAVAGLRMAYRTAYQASAVEWTELPILKSGRSSRRPLWEKSTSGRLSKLCEFWEDAQSRFAGQSVLILSLSIEGLTTNLQSLSLFARNMSKVDVTLGFCLTSKYTRANFGQTTKGDREWVFYSLKKLQENIIGRSTDDKYMRLIKALFLIQKAKQTYIIDHSIILKSLSNYSLGYV